MREIHDQQAAIFATVFNDVTASYKFFWFLALVSHIDGSSVEITLSDLFREMVALSWHPLVFYRLSFGPSDKLQSYLDLLREDRMLRERLKPNARRHEIVRELEFANDRMTRIESELMRYVPTRFIAPWFRDFLRAKQPKHEEALTKLIISQAREVRHSLLAAPYYFSDDHKRIILDPAWHRFFKQHQSVLSGNARYHLALFLQKRNPNVPGIADKFDAPSKRNLSAAKRLFADVRDKLRRANKPDIIDIYTGKPLESDIEIDHFLPWRFVVHDELWNLTPVNANTNNSKSDDLPNLERFLPTLSDLHWRVLQTLDDVPEDYIIGFKLNANQMRTLSRQQFCELHKQIIRPQAQIAQNMGFKVWPRPLD
jgi:hypothetical protein